MQSVCVTREAIDVNRTQWPYLFCFVCVFLSWKLKGFENNKRVHDDLFGCMPVCASVLEYGADGGGGVWLIPWGIYFLSLNFKSIYKNSIRDASEMGKN